MKARGVSSWMEACLRLDVSGGVLLLVVVGLPLVTTVGFLVGRD